MGEKNYNEQVIIPYLEKRCKDLLSINLIMEAKLLAEMEKTKDLQAYVVSLEEKIESNRKSKRNHTWPISEN